MSVLTPMSTAVLTYDLRDPEGEFRSRSSEPLRSRWIAAGLYGLVVGLAGVCWWLSPSRSPPGRAAATDPWAGAAPAVVGCLLLQLIPVGVGCAAGLWFPGPGWRRCRQ